MNIEQWTAPFLIYITSYNTHKSRFIKCAHSQSYRTRFIWTSETPNTVSLAVHIDTLGILIYSIACVYVLLPATTSIHWKIHSIEKLPRSFSFSIVTHRLESSWPITNHQSLANISRTVRRNKFKRNRLYFVYIYRLCFWIVKIRSFYTLIFEKISKKCSFNHSDRKWNDTCRNNDVNCEH